MFYFSKNGLKFWVCVKHYDDMAAHYRKIANDGDPWSKEMVEANGW